MPIISSQRFPSCPLLFKLWQQFVSLSVFCRCFGGGSDYESDCESDINDDWSEASQDVASPLLPEYDIEGLLGSGTFGCVVAGRKTRGAGAGGQLVAIKIMDKKDIAAERGGIERLRQEKEALQTMSSPFVITLMETWQGTSHVFFTTKLMLGGDLEERLKAFPEEGFPGPQVKFYVANLVEALTSIHSMGLAHRDIKPANVLIDDRGYLQVADFGVSKKIHANKTFTHVGTPMFFAPEVLTGTGYGQAVDIWALGVVMLEMAKGLTPDSSTLAPRPLQLIDDINLVEDSSCRDVIAKALTFDPEERVSNVGVGFAELRSHSWFLGFDWEELRATRLPAPWVPDGSSRSFEDADLWQGEDFDEPYTGDQAIFEGF